MQPWSAETISRAKAGVAGLMSVETRLNREHTCAFAVYVQVQLLVAFPAETKSCVKSCIAGYMSVEMHLHRVHTCACGY